MKLPGRTRKARVALFLLFLLSLGVWGILIHFAAPLDMFPSQGLVAGAATLNDALWEELQNWGPVQNPKIVLLSYAPPEDAIIVCRYIALNDGKQKTLHADLHFGRQDGRWFFTRKTNGFARCYCSWQ